MDKQQKNQMKLNEQGRDLSMDLWNKQNVGAQLKHIDDAGLSAGLMYGGGGAGGKTVAMGGGGAAGGSSPMSSPMDIGSMLDAAMKKAQIKNVEADTKSKVADAENKGTDTEIKRVELEFLGQEKK